MRLARAVASAAALLFVGAPAALAAPPVQGPGADCDAPVGQPGSSAIPWAQTRLGFDKVRPLATGAGVLVAVVDGGLNRENPQTARIAITRPTNVLGHGYAADDIRDCQTHGTAVTSIIAAPPVNGVGFVGLAPGVTVMPIKEFDDDTAKLSDANTIAAGIQAAVAAHARVVNLSLTAIGDTPALRAAMDAALRADVVVVTAAGNSGNNGDTAGYPAAYGTKYPNVLAVSAIDEQDKVANFSTTGTFVGVAAPGAGILAASPHSGYSAQNDGTSFAAPFVTATAALVRQRFPALTAPQVINRIKATADRPGVSVPDPAYGYGIVDPYLAITAVRDDTVVTPQPAAAPPVPAPVRPAPPDRHLQHLAYGIAAALLGAAVIVALGAVVARRTFATARDRSG